MVGIGKAVGGGLPLGVYGMTAELKDAFERGASVTGRQGELATGGTMFGNALSMAAARAVLTEVLTAGGLRPRGGARRARSRTAWRPR